MQKHILIIQGHPDVDKLHFCHAIASAYKNGSRNNNYNVKNINVAQLKFSILHTQDEFEHDKIVEDIKTSQDLIRWVNHIVINYQLWLGAMPALLKGLFEQTFRYRFAISNESKKTPKKLLKGESAQIIITMGMPAFVYRWLFSAHSLKCLKKSILGLAGIKHSLIGTISSSNSKRGKWLKKIQVLSQKAI
ncbi:MAG: NAD(P)H-dependent oxidoreductase [Gammaproteobacteria bacterium]